MAGDTLQIQASQEKPLVDIRTVARRCGIKVLIAAPVAIAALALIGKIIERRAEIWAQLLWLLSFGGHFWGAVVVGGLALTANAWGACVHSHLPDDAAAKAKTVITGASAFATCCMVLASISLLGLYGDFSSLTVYQQIAAICMYGSSVISMFFVVIIGLLESNWLFN